MNYSNKATGFATGEHNPSNKLTEEQRNNRSKNHWSKTVEARSWLSENNPSKRSDVKLKRKESQIKNWNDPNYREKYTGCNHWIHDIKNKESAENFLKVSKSNLESINKKASIKKLELDPIRKHLKYTTVWRNKKEEKDIRNQIILYLHILRKASICIIGLLFIFVLVVVLTSFLILFLSKSVVRLVVLL